MKVSILYVGSSLLAPLRNAEAQINLRHGLALEIATYNFGSAFTDDEWLKIENDLDESEVIFVIHVMDGENATRLLPQLDRLRKQHTVIVINCMPALMKRTRMGKLDFAKLSGQSRKGKAQRAKDKGAEFDEVDSHSLLKSIGSWIGRQARNGKSNGHGRTDYLKWADRLPKLMRFIPSTGPLGDAKNYLLLMSYFLQPTPRNIESMILMALKGYVDDERLKSIDIPQPESVASVAIYHPDAPALFQSFEEYENWYVRDRPKAKAQSTKFNGSSLNPNTTIGLLLMRPQIVSNSRKHYDALIRAIEAEGLSVIPAISTLMDNREACEKFFVGTQASGLQTSKQARGLRTQPGTVRTQAGSMRTARVSQIVSLTGFSFVGGPAMNDSEAASEYLTDLNIPYRSLVSLDAQTIESWRESFTGLNPVQTGMQVAIPEIDGATEPFVFGGIPARGVEPAPLEERCARVAKRMNRWNRLQTANRSDLKIALVIYCFPPNKGNIGTAADLDVFASVLDVLSDLRAQGYAVEVPATADRLREILLNGNSRKFETNANVAYRMSVDEYRELNPFVADIEREWGAAPGAINARDNELLIQGVTLDNIFIGVQPTFGYEDDPMRLLMAKGGTPHHGFAAFYTYLERTFKADAVVHVGTHGAMEFMPGKQIGMSSECWPDRLIGELPNIYIYSVNNPSEGTIAKRRSYAELISYLTPPIESAGLYKGLATLKELIQNYRHTTDEEGRERLYQAIEELRENLNLELSEA
ncbi:MAG TPA: cobaltochelatase subunit CobN [Pyrinomonadaceae bacterium]|nr:cobaltochelatase subunit CobN [Pyrinomonadaceae bacterium]